MELKVEASLALRYWNDPILSTVCEPVRGSEFGEKLQSFANKLESKMHEFGGVGLAASQLGIPIRVFSMRLIPGSDSTIALTVCNPTLVLSGDTIYEQEGCLSLPGVYSQVTRAQIAMMRYFTPLGEENELELHALNARIAAHEFDHLNGVMFIDRLATRQLRKAALREWEKTKHKYV